MTQRFRLIGALVFGVAGALALVFAVRARAAGIPEADGMTYTGYLEDGAGQPLTGEHSIAVQFWESAEAEDDLCTASLDSAELQSGRFQVPLPVSCSEAVKASPDVWASVSVDGASLGRTKLGTVPYALEAGRATTADAASGALAGQLEDLAAAVDSQAADGYVRLGDTQIAWGTATFATGSGVNEYQDVTMPVGFVGASYTVQANINEPGTVGGVLALARPKNATQFVLQAQGAASNTAGTNRKVSWLAVGRWQ